MNQGPEEHRSGQTSARKLRIATYNIRKCVGLDWQRRADRTMSVIRELQADVVALQEADRRFGARHATLPNALVSGTGLCFVPIREGGASSGHHGNAILVRADIGVTRAVSLDLPSFEPRGALVVDLTASGLRLRVVATHLGLRAIDRRRQAQAILAALERLDGDLPTLLLGDFNEWAPLGAAAREFSANFTPAPPLPSFHSAAVVAPLDRIFMGEGIHLHRAGVHRSPASRRASDHLPVWADVSFGAADSAPSAKPIETEGRN